MHKEMILWSRTDSDRHNFKTFTINICGGQAIELVDEKPAVFNLNLKPGETSSLAKLSEIGNFTEWFTKNDDLCDWSGFFLKKLNNDTELFEPFSHEMITLDIVANDILIKTDTFLEISFFLKTTSTGGPGNSKQISIFICGQEKVSTEGGADKIEKSWDDDTVYDISEATVTASFKSSEDRCPVVSYYLTPSLSETDPKLALFNS
jgi:hypothetical protein